MELRRSHYCGKISESDIDSTAVAMGWVGTSRDMGGIIFIDLRDKTGVMQVVFDFKNFTDEDYLVIEKLRSEDVILVKGKIRERDEETYNTKIPTGTVELAAEELQVLSKADVLPFQIDDNLEVREDLRLKYRYLDLRRPKMYENFKKRNETVRSIREYLELHDFLEVETPILTKSTPEGARDYLVPSRVHPGDFYALPQSPQIFKQLLMVSGFDRYYQVARCFRDEDLRADRQPEFTQVDIETSFMSKNEILEHLEKLFKKVFKDVLDIDIKEDFPRITYQEAMLKYGSDKPDIRFGLEIVDITELAGRTSFKVFTDAVKNGGLVRAINIKGGNTLTRSEIEELTEKAISFGAKGMAWLGINDDGSLRTILDKYISDDQMKELFEIMDVENGDFLVFSADTEDIVINTLGRLRLEIGDLLGLRKKDDYKFLMVVDFPLFEYSEEDERYVAMHHPFTMPVAEDVDTFDKDPASARAESYDVVLNGVELGSGSLRIYRPDIQQRMFRMLGLNEEEIEERFGFILEAFRFGTPPHGGFAFGLDRLVMLMLQENSIREVIAFPKNREAEDTMTEAPSTVRDEQLEELSLAVLGEDGSIRGSAMLDNRVEDKVDIKALCDLSELNIEHEEEYEAYIESMIKMTAEFREKDFSEFDRIINIHPVENAFRKDEVEQLLTREELLAHIDLNPSGHIVLPSVIEED